ncbi:hypothetical protein L484_018184 [Morus notabilis]|uniref:Uncharacterized protein n=1 Tax=Morus notabilis TaxID=981085 RepID=W9R9S2_9ROSA|nr:hypothetical protein L484_018184 [Morus notabilis]
MGSTSSVSHHREPKPLQTPESSPAFERPKNLGTKPSKRRLALHSFRIPKESTEESESESVEL